MGGADETMRRKEKKMAQPNIYIFEKEKSTDESMALELAEEGSSSKPSDSDKAPLLPLPETSSSLKHRSNNINIQIGAIVRLPEKRRCPIKKCAAQKDHTHGDKEYRSRMFPIWKRQNPNYGENYPRLIRYKLKNRGKKNVY